MGRVGACLLGWVMLSCAGGAASEDAGHRPTGAVAARAQGQAGDAGLVDVGDRIRAQRQAREELIGQLSAELQLVDKIANESESREDRERARKRSAELEKQLRQARTPSLSTECVANPLHPECR